MWILSYTIATLLLLLFLLDSIFLFERSRKTILVLLTMFLVFVLHYFYNYECVVDFTPYINFAKNCGNGFSVFQFLTYEPGYVLFNHLFMSLTKTSLLVILSAYAFFILLFFRSFSKYSPYPFLSVFLFFCSMYIDIPLRQAIATSIFVNSIGAIQENNLKKYIIYFLLATSFHLISLLMLPAFFLSRIRFSLSSYILILLGCFIVGVLFDLKSFIGLLLHFFKKGAYTDNGVESIGLTLGMVLQIVYFSISLYYLYLSSYDYKFRLIFNLYFIGLCIYFLFNSIPAVATRGSEFFSVMIFYTLPFCLSVSTRVYNKIVLCIMFAVLNIYILTTQISNATEYSYSNSILIK